MSWGGHRVEIHRAVRAVRRELFVPDEQRQHAHKDKPLPIGWEQTISQPSLVEYMTEQLALTPRSRVLEIGTGSGYQTAILAEIASEVFTIERLPQLADTARELLSRLGYRNIHFRLGDGALGWPEAAPFSAIMATAAAFTLPAALVEQLAPGGRLVVPVGPAPDDQVLLLVEKQPDGSVESRELCGVRFVPLISETQRKTGNGKHGEKRSSPSDLENRALG
jgi:protein-L-isoaspartate(D-aspartate) O-methyltransferase